VRFYRAVSEAELEDIRAFGGFRREPGGHSLESKQFAVSLHGAAEFGRGNFELDGKPFCVVEVKVEEADVESFERLRLDGKPAMNVSREGLGVFNAIIRNVREVSALPLRRS
jgi:hypothetical protein